jgi:hypothetical protein
MFEMTAFWDLAAPVIGAMVIALMTLRSSETSFFFSDATRRCITEVCYLHTRCRENLKLFVPTQCLLPSAEVVNE